MNLENHSRNLDEKSIQKKIILEEISNNLDNYTPYYMDEKNNWIKNDKDIENAICDKILEITNELWSHDSYIERLDYNTKEWIKENNKIQEIIKQKFLDKNLVFVRLLLKLSSVETIDWVKNNNNIQKFFKEEYLDGVKKGYGGNEDYLMLMNEGLTQKVLIEAFSQLVKDGFDIDDYEISSQIRFAKEDTKKLLNKNLKDREIFEDKILETIRKKDNLFNLIKLIIDTGYGNFFLKKIYYYFDEDETEIVKALKLFSDFGKGEAIDECLPEVTDESEDLLEHRRNISHSYSKNRLKILENKIEDHNKFLKENEGFDIRDDEAVVKYKSFCKERFSSDADINYNEYILESQITKNNILKKLKKKHLEIFENNRNKKLGDIFIEDEDIFYKKMLDSSHRFGLYRTKENIEHDKYTFIFPDENKRILNKNEFQQFFMWLDYSSKIYGEDGSIYDKEAEFKFDDFIIDESVDYYLQKEIVFDKYSNEIKELYNDQTISHALGSQFEFRNKREMYENGDANYEQSGIIVERMVFAELNNFINKISLPKGINISVDLGMVFEDFEYKADIVIRIKENEKKLKRHGIQLALDSFGSSDGYFERKEEQIKGVLEKYDYLENLELIKLFVDEFRYPREALDTWNSEGKYEEGKMPQDYLKGFYEQDIIKRCFEGILPGEYFENKNVA